MSKIVDFPSSDERGKMRLRELADALRPALFKQGLSPSQVDWSVEDLRERFARIDAALPTQSTPHQIALALLEELMRAVGEIYQLEVLGERTKV